MDDLSLRYEHAFDVRINFDMRWTVGPIAESLHHGYTSVGAGVQLALANAPG